MPSQPLRLRSRGGRVGAAAVGSRAAGGACGRRPAGGGHAEGDRAARISRGRRRRPQPRLARGAAVARLRDRSRPRGSPPDALDAALGARRPLGHGRAGLGLARGRASSISTSSTGSPRAASSRDLEAAAALHRGPFLAGFGLRDSTVFDDWQSFRAASLARELGAVLDRLADGCAASGERCARSSMRDAGSRSIRSTRPRTGG